jgi:hypothetical protein
MKLQEWTISGPLKQDRQPSNVYSLRSMVSAARTGSSKTAPTTLTMPKGAKQSHVATSLLTERRLVNTAGNHTARSGQKQTVSARQRSTSRHSRPLVDTRNGSSLRLPIRQPGKRPAFANLSHKLSRSSSTASKATSRS